MVLFKNIRHFCGCIFVALCMVIFIVSVTAETEFDGYIVKLSQPLPAMSPLSENGEVIKELENHENVYVVEDVAIIDELVESGIVVFAEPNYILEPLDCRPDDTKYAEQWSLDSINYPTLYQNGYSGEGVVVAVIDSGLDVFHPDLSGANISIYSKNFLGDGTHADVYFRDQLGHGTFVTSQIVAVTDNAEGIAGIADDVTLMVLRCVSKSTSRKYAYNAAYDSGSGSVSVVSGAIRYATDNGADVINISLGMTNNSTLLTEAINYASANGVIVVAAVGNSGSTKMYYPANCENVIGVASVSRSGGTLIKSSFSQYNTSVDITAPGGSVLGIQIYPETNGIWYTSAAETYLFDSGTSYASPVVAALAAIAKQVNPALDCEDFLSLLTVSARDLGTAGYDTSYGYGIADAKNLLEALTVAEHCITYVLNDSEDSVAQLPGEYATGYKLNAKNELALPMPQRDGYIFKGWCMDAQCGTDAFFTLPQGTLGSASAKISGGAVIGYEISPVTLYAKWEIGSSVATQSANYDVYTDDDLSVELIMPGNSFVGVMIDGESIADTAFVYNEGVVNFYAQFLKTLAIGTHILRFRFEFGEDSIFTLNITDSAPLFDVVFYPAYGFENAHFVLEDVRVGDTIGNLPAAPVLADRRFVGWYLSDKTTRITKNTVVTADMSIYATWVYTGDGEDPGLDESMVTTVDIMQITAGAEFDKVERRANGIPFAVYDVLISGYASPLGTTVEIGYSGESAYVYRIVGDSIARVEADVKDEAVSFKAVSGNSYVVASDSLVLYGDANADGRLSLLDIIRILKRVSDSNIVLDFAAADIDGDCEVNVRDILFALRILLNNS